MTDNLMHNANKFWLNKAKSFLTSGQDPTRHGDNVRIRYDIAQLKNIIKDNSSILDLGCGTGILIKELDKNFKKLNFVAVDNNEIFLNQIKTKNTLKILSDAVDFKTNLNFDYVLTFGLFNHITHKHTCGVISYLSKITNTLIVKQQFGLKTNVYVNKFSQELQSNYSARYPSYIAFRKLLLRFFKSVEVVDIYPKEMNPYKNTHHFMFICSSF